jgi:hypothetical protein
VDVPEPLTRRRALRLAAGGLLAAPVALRLARPTAAARAWCRTDPGVTINGIRLQVYPERDAAEANTCTGPIRLVFSVTPGSTTSVDSQDAGFGYGYAISFEESAKVGTGQYKVAMYVPAATGMAVQLVCDPVDPRAKTTDKRGSANTWLTVGTKF